MGAFKSDISVQKVCIEGKTVRKRLLLIERNSSLVQWEENHCSHLHVSVQTAENNVILMMSNSGTAEFTSSDSGLVHGTTGRARARL